MESKLKTKGHELEESQKRLDKLEEHIRVSKIQLDEQEKMASDLQGNVGCSKERIAELQQELVSQEQIPFRLSILIVKEWEVLFSLNIIAWKGTLNKLLELFLAGGMH